MSHHPKQTTCIRCGGTMESGELVDRSEGMPTSWITAERPLEWIRGKVSKKLRFLDGNAGERLQVTTFRCTSRGYIDLYANPLATQDEPTT